MGNQITKETPVDNTTKTDQPKEYGPEPYFTNPAAHLRQPNEIPQLRQPAVTADDWEEIDGEWVIVNTPQAADTSEELDGDWVIVETPQGETKVPAANPPARMNRSFTVPVPCNTCGEPFQEQLHTQSVDCMSCSIDKEQRDKEQRQKDYNAFMHPSGSPGTPLSVYDDIDSPLSDGWDLSPSSEIIFNKKLSDESRVRDAEVVYCNQKWFMSGPWRNHPIDKDVADTLLGSRPDNFDEMQKIYDNHVERMRKGEHATDEGSDRLAEWQRWQKCLRSDLKCVDEFLHNANSRNIKFVPLWAGTPIGGRQLEGCFRDISVTDTTVKSWAAVLKTGPKKFRNPIQEAKDAAKAAKAEESIRRREEEEKADAAYRKQMEHRRIHTESYQRMKKKSEERTNKRRNAVRQMNEMEDHEDFWGVGHENRMDLGERYGDDIEYRTKWENLEEQMWDS